jgi:nitroreductase
MLLDILKKRFTTKHWDSSRIVSQSDIDYITDCIHSTPMKMGYPGYQVMLLTDSEKGRKIKEWLFYEHSWTCNGDRNNHDDNFKRDYKGQYLAPILLAFLRVKDLPRKTIMEGVNGSQETNLPNFEMRLANVCMAAMTAIMAAEERGLNTGITTCHEGNEVAQYLDLPNHECPMMIGIGYALDMQTDIDNMNLLIPVADPSNSTNTLGNCFVNLPAHYPKPVRVAKPSKTELVITV